jgi:hypothetical protein
MYKNTIAVIPCVHNLAGLLRRERFTGIIKQFRTCVIKFSFATQNKRVMGGKLAIRILEAHAASGISFDLRIEFCVSRKVFCASRFSELPDYKGLYNRMNSPEFVLVT